MRNDASKTRHCSKTHRRRRWGRFRYFPLAGNKFLKKLLLLLLFKKNNDNNNWIFDINRRTLGSDRVVAVVLCSTIITSSQPVIASPGAYRLPHIFVFLISLFVALFRVASYQNILRTGQCRVKKELRNEWHHFFFQYIFRAKAEQVKITLGEYSLNSDVEPLSPVQVGVAEIHVHPYFKFTPQADRYDVAVLRLDRYVPYEPHISPICLPEKGDDFLGEYAWAAGWGAMQAGRFSNHFESFLNMSCQMEKNNWTNVLIIRFWF